MGGSGFDDYVLTALGGARNSADGSPLSLRQKSDVAAYLCPPGSGPDAIINFEVYLSRTMRAAPPELSVGTDILAFQVRIALGTGDVRSDNAACRTGAQLEDGRCG